MVPDTAASLFITCEALTLKIIDDHSIDWLQEAAVVRGPATRSVRRPVVPGFVVPGPRWR